MTENSNSPPRRTRCPTTPPPVANPTSDSNLRAGGSQAVHRRRHRSVERTSPRCCPSCSSYTVLVMGLSTLITICLDSLFVSGLASCRIPCPQRGPPQQNCQKESGRCQTHRRRIAASRGTSRSRIPPRHAPASSAGTNRPTCLGHGAEHRGSSRAPLGDGPRSGRRRQKLAELLSCRRGRRGSRRQLPASSRRSSPRGPAAIRPGH